MDWPVAAVLLGTLGTIAAAILRLIPQRVENTHGEACASKADALRLQQLLEEHQKYSETRNHDILNGQTKLQSFIADQIDGTENKLWGKLDAMHRDVLVRGKDNHGP